LRLGGGRLRGSEEGEEGRGVVEGGEGAVEGGWRGVAAGVILVAAGEGDCFEG